MKMLVGDKWIDGDERIEVRDPFDDSVVDTIPRATPADIETALATADEGLEVCKRMTVYQRATVLRDTANLVEKQGEEFARTIAREGSKTINEARKEVARCVNVLNVAADNSKHVRGETIPFDSFLGGENRKGWFERVPIGCVAAITPFNDPLNLVAHKLAPAVASGNTVILKPASQTPLSGIKLVEAFVESGLPPKVVQVLTGNASDFGDSLITDPRVRMVSFTGGVDTGKMIAGKAGLKKLSMELGSNSPVIVCEDADLDWAAQTCVDGSFGAAGQNCLGVQRIYVHDSVYERYRDDFVARTKKLRIGDKLDEKTDMGPVIDEGAAARIETWIQEAADSGADILTGGRREGRLVQPTVLENVPTSVKVHCEEVFGPVVNLYRYSDLDDAIERANSLHYGIHSAVFTRNANTAFYVSERLECGGDMINDSTDYRLDAMPFGGIGDSGLGREGVRFAIEEMTEPKVYCWLLPESH